MNLTDRIMSEMDKLAKAYDQATEAHIVAVIHAGYVIDHIEYDNDIAATLDSPIGSNRTIVTKCGKRLATPTQSYEGIKITMSYPPIPVRTGSQRKLDTLEAIEAWIGDKTPTSDFRIQSTIDNGFKKLMLVGKNGTYFPSWLNDVRYFDGEKQQALDDIKLLRSSSLTRIQKDMLRYQTALESPPDPEDNHAKNLENAIIKHKEALARYTSVINKIRSIEELPDHTKIGSAANSLINAELLLKMIQNNTKKQIVETHDVSAYEDALRKLNFHVYGAACRLGVSYWSRSFPFEGEWMREAPSSSYAETSWVF